MNYYEKLSKAIIRAIKTNPEDVEAYLNYMDLCREWEKEEFKAAQDANHAFRELVSKGMRAAVEREDFVEGEKLNSILFSSLLMGAPYYFDDYLQAVEYGRPADKKFYQPRRHYLKPMIQGYQDIADGKLRLLTISMPKRAGKSQTGINFVNFLSGRNPDRSTLMEGTGDDLVRSFYTGLLEYVQTPNEYHFYDIFPGSPLVQTNADTKTINLLHKSRFPTVMCRSIDSRQVGLSEATNLLYLDDCVEGREEAKNRIRLDAKWEIISGDILGRAIEGTPIVATGTRYSLYDPIGHLQEEAKKQHWAWRAIEIPALDPITDESNYEYIRDGKKVFTTAYFREQREMLSAEQFESEFQQQPFEAKGLLFPEKELNYYFELPVDCDPDAIVAVCDTADKGSDFTSMPVAYIYGDEVYLEDVVFDDAPPSVTKPEVANCIMKNGVLEGTFESNNAGTYYARDISNLLKNQGYVCNIRTKRTISNKQTRIEFASDNIKKHFYFKHPSTYKRNSQYAEFMRNVTTYTRSGKVEHDDGPDSLSLLENEMRKRIKTTVEVFSRPF